MNRFLFLLILLISNSAFAAKESIYTKTAPDPIGIYSQAIKIGNTVYISGQIPIDPKTGELVPGNFNEQVKQSLLNVNEIAKAAGGNIDNIVKVNVYLLDLNNFALLNEAMEAVFHLPYAARSVVEVKALPKNAMVEIEAVMRLEDTKAICKGDITEMNLQIIRYSKIESADGYYLDEVTLHAGGELCSGAGSFRGHRICTLKWAPGNWGDTLRCD
jgi:2-iminobutanoate/2-iminopropanoate deaminase